MLLDQGFLGDRYQHARRAGGDEPRQAIKKDFQVTTRKFYQTVRWLEKKAGLKSGSDQPGGRTADPDWACCWAVEGNELARHQVWMRFTLKCIRLWTFMSCLAHMPFHCSVVSKSACRIAEQVGAFPSLKRCTSRCAVDVGLGLYPCRVIQESWEFGHPV